ncbi:MAG: hypothetical protein K2H88_08750, partial [Duncaniella sp.]|nr:hypothetical protein [Duncaniella sp.]
MSINKKILLCLAHMSGNEQRFIDEAFAGNWVGPLGPNVDAFEHSLEDFLCDNTPSPLRVAAVSSGTAAIWLVANGNFTNLTDFNGHSLNPVWAADGKSYYYTTE